LLILSVDAKRAADPDVAGDAERERLLAMAGQWSREDLLRAFDLLTKAEQDIRVSDQPRFNLEMALLRLMHLRKLVPLTDLLTGAAPSGRTVTAAPRASLPQVPSARPVVPNAARPTPAPTPPSRSAPSAAANEASFKDRLLADVRSGKTTFYNLVVASAYRIDASPDGVTFTFLPNQKNAKAQCEEQKAWLQSIAEKIAGRPVPVSITVAEGAASPATPAAPAAVREQSVQPQRDVKEEAMANSTVQAVLEIFPVEKTTIEER
jgi:DNA polymerase-3 subunit gamma/tau